MLVQPRAPSGQSWDPQPEHPKGGRDWWGGVACQLSQRRAGNIWEQDSQYIMLGTSRPTPGQSPFQTRKQEGSVRDFQHVPLQGRQTCSGFGSRRKEKPTASFSGTYRFQALAPTFPFPTAGVCSKDRRGPCTIILRTKISQNPGML